MTEPHDPHRTVDVSSSPADSLDAGLAAGFGKPAEAPRSSLAASQRPVLLHEAEGDSAHVVKPHSDAMPPKGETGDRYQLFGEIARGGMGAVLRGRDVDLGRDLAVKVLLEKHADNPAVARRFLEEAQIGGQLQHPGVVPVYDIGRFGDRPFFTMKLVKGHTLAALLAERSPPVADAPGSPAELPRFLGIALQVAQALAYAHAKGVIHRDLKPANIMVGAFGEVQVMDWGLAKVLAEGGVADEERTSRERQRSEEGTLIRTARSSGSVGSFGTDTEAGSLLGTPAYMPPEQANGDVALLDRRADVFGLGAILCEVLTGKPPYLGRSGEEVRRKAANGDLGDAMARLDSCGADQELIALTRVCLSPELIDRPKDAQEVADALTDYLNGVQERLRQTELARAQADVKASEERKRRRVQLALAGALACLLALGAGSGLYLHRQHELRQAAVATTLEKVADLRKQARWAEAASLLEQSRSQLGEPGPAGLRASLEEALADVTLVQELEAVRLRKSTWFEGKFDNAGADREYAEVFVQRGLARPGDDIETVAAWVRNSAVKEPLLAALDDWAFTTNERKRADWLMGVARAADPHPWRDRLRDRAVWRNQRKLHALAAEAKGEDLSPQVAAALGWELEIEKAVELLREAQQRYPADFWVNLTLGTRLMVAKQEEAAGYLRVAVALRPVAVVAYNNLAEALKHAGKRDEAIACYRKAVELAPANSWGHNNLGVALAHQGLWDEAIACYKNAIALNSELAAAHSNLGSALAGKGRVDEAIACFKKAIKLDPKFAGPHTGLGIALQGKGRLDEAIACHKKAIKLDPNFAVAHYNLGAVLCVVKRDYAGAIACFEKAIALDSKYALAHTSLGNVLSRKGQVDAAIALHKKAIELDPKCASAYINLGAILCDSKRDYDGAIACFRRAIVLAPEDAQAHTNLGNALAGKGEVDEAIACYRQAIALDSKLAEAHNNLGVALTSQVRLDEAIACYKKAIELDPKDAVAYVALGHAFWGKGCFAEARDASVQARALLPANHPLRAEVSQQLQECRRLLKLEARLPSILRGEGQPAFARESLDLAQMCAHKKLHAASASFSVRAFADDPKLADDLKARYRYKAACFAALASAGQGEDVAKLDDKERTRLRKQALDWLRSDLAQYTKRLDSGTRAVRRMVRQQMQNWQKDSDLAVIRDQAALDKLLAKEREVFVQLWADVAALLKKAEAPAKKETKS